MSRELVSILIPCHNAARWLEQTLASARAQTWPHIEIIVVDDGSTDESLAIARRRASAQIQVLTQPKAGAAAARQRALASAQGDFLQYLDADDLLAPDKIACQLARLHEAGPRSIASGRWGRFESDVSVTKFATESNWHDFAPIEYVVTTFESGGMMHPAAWLLPRAVVDATGPWNHELGLDDDGEYFTRAALAAERVIFCADAVSYYRSNLTHSLSGTRTSAAWRSAYAVCELSTRALLAQENSPRTRRACALYWLRFAFAAYPEGNEWVNPALAHARALDPAARRPRSGPTFELGARVLGWRATKRLRHALRH